MYRLIGAASGWGAQHKECEGGPDALKRAHLMEWLQERGIHIAGWETHYPALKATEAMIALPERLYDFNLHLAVAVEKALSLSEFPIVLGGDHSIAIGTWNGAYQFLKKNLSLPLGLIWIDAHMDSHILKTSPSDAWHGMPLASLLGHGSPSMAKLKEKEPVLLAENICVIGCSSFEPEEAKFLQRLNVRTYFLKDILERGLDAVMEEAIHYVTRHTRSFGVSLDLDVINPQEAPGVGSPVTGGLQAKELLQALSHLKRNKHFKLFELVELNPTKDIDNKTIHLCFEILKTIMRTNG